MKPFTSKHSQASRLLKYNAVDDHASALHKKTKYSDVIASTDEKIDSKGNKTTTEIVHKGGPIGPGENTFGTIGGERRGMGRLGEKVYKGRVADDRKGSMISSKVLGSGGFRTSIDPITGEKTSFVKEKSASAITPKGLTPLKVKGRNVTGPGIKGAIERAGRKKKKEKETSNSAVQVRGRNVTGPGIKGAIERAGRKKKKKS